jgi:hypothetical protein
MIDFSTYIGQEVVLITNSFDSFDEISGIRINDSKLFKYKDKWVWARSLTLQDLKDDDYLQWLDNIWRHDENHLRSFLRHKKEYQHHEAEKH